MPRSTLHLLAAALLAGACMAAPAATVDVQVQDAAGRPLAGAAVFLQSKEAHAATRPGPVVDVVQVNRQFQPQVAVVTVGYPGAAPSVVESEVTRPLEEAVNAINGRFRPEAGHSLMRNQTC